MHGEWVRLGTHFFQSCFGFINRRAEVPERVPKPICLHTVHPNISARERSILKISVSMTNRITGEGEFAIWLDK